MARTRRKKHTVFKTFAILCALVLVVGATVAVTLALLNNTSETKTNTFVSDNRLDVELREDEWDKLGGGKEKAEVYTPGLVVPKDPTLYNITKIEKSKVPDSDGTPLDTLKASLEYKAKSEYVALKLQYQVLKANLSKEDLINADTLDEDENWEDISYDKFIQLADIKHKNGSSVLIDGFNTGNANNEWTAKSDGEYGTSTSMKYRTVFYYNSSLGPDIAAAKCSDGITAIVGADTDKSNQTSALFDAVTIKEELTQETIFECGNDAVDLKKHFNGDAINAGAWPVDGSSNPIKTWSNLTAMGVTGDTFTTPAPNKTSPYKFRLNAASEDIYVHVGLVPFRIKVTGYAVQANINNAPMDAPGAAGTTAPDAVDELDKLMGIVP